MMTLDFSIDELDILLFLLSFVSVGIGALVALLGIHFGNMVLGRAKTLNTLSSRTAATFIGLNFWEPAIGMVGSVCAFFWLREYVDDIFGRDGLVKLFVLYSLVYLSAPALGLFVRGSFNRWHSVTQAFWMWSRWAINLGGTFLAYTLDNRTFYFLPLIVGPIWLIATFLIARLQFKNLIAQDARLALKLPANAFSLA